jgi:integrase
MPRAATGKLTTKELEKLVTDARADPSLHRLVYDAAAPGLAVRLRGGGASYVYRYRDTAGRERQLSLGRVGALTLAQARKAANLRTSDRVRGKDPAGARDAAREAALTVADVAELYLADLEERAGLGMKRGRLSTAAEFRRLAERHLLPRLGAVRMVDLDEKAVEALHRAMAATPGQANRALTLLSAVVGFAEKRKLRPLGANPCRVVSRYEERGVRGRLTLAELARLGEAMREAEANGAAPAPVLLGLRLLALTGMRRSEVFGFHTRARQAEGAWLVWGDVDLEGRFLRLRHAKAGARDVPLGRAAAAVLAAARPVEVEPGAPVCPGQLPGRPFVGIDRVWRRLYAAAGIAGRDLHTLRHTFSSVAADAGLGEFIVGGLLGHRSGTVTGRYVHPDRDPLHQAADLVSGTIAAALAGGQPAVVLSFPAPRDGAPA